VLFFSVLGAYLGKSRLFAVFVLGAFREVLTANSGPEGQEGTKTHVILQGEHDDHHALPLLAAAWVDRSLCATSPCA